MFRMKPIFLFVLSGLGTCRPAVEIPMGTRTTLTHAQYIFLRLMLIDLITGPCPARQNILDHGSLRLPGLYLALGSPDTAVPKVWKTQRVPEAGRESWNQGVEECWGGRALHSGHLVPRFLNWVKFLLFHFVATFAQDASNLKFYFFKLLPRAGAYPTPALFAGIAGSCPHSSSTCWDGRLSLFPAWFSAAVTCKHSPPWASPWDKPGLPR